MTRFRIYTAHRNLLPAIGIAIVSEPSHGFARARMAALKRVRPYRSLWIQEFHFDLLARKIIRPTAFLAAVFLGMYSNSLPETSGLVPNCFTPSPRVISSHLSNQVGVTRWQFPQAARLLQTRKD